jgi:hypothetical protein
LVKAAGSVASCRLSSGQPIAVTADELWQQMSGWKALCDGECADLERAGDYVEVRGLVRPSPA